LEITNNIVYFCGGGALETLKLNNMSRQERETAWRLINNYRFHSNETGFLEWKDFTPTYVKELFSTLINQTK